MTLKDKTYRWWLYHGPGLKGIRRALRINDEILPIKGEVRDSVYTGSTALEAEHEVEKLREQIPPDYSVEFSHDYKPFTLDVKVNPVAFALPQGESRTPKNRAPRHP